MKNLGECSDILALIKSKSRPVLKNWAMKTAFVIEESCWEWVSWPIQEIRPVIMTYNISLIAIMNSPMPVPKIFDHVLSWKYALHIGALYMTWCFSSYQVKSPSYGFRYSLSVWQKHCIVPVKWVGRGGFASSLSWLILYSFIESVSQGPLGDRSEWYDRATAWQSADGYLSFAELLMTLIL